MPSSRTVNFILILMGGIVAIYAEAQETQNIYILLGGVMILMIGLYRLSKGISSKKDDQDTTIFEDKE